MRLEGFTTSVTSAQTANVAITLEGMSADLAGQAFKSIRVKGDESGFELTRKAEVVAVDEAGSYSLSGVDADAFVIVSAAPDGVVVDLNVLPYGTNVGLWNNTGDVMEIVEAGGAAIITAPDGFTPFIEANGIAQLKSVDGNTWVLFGNLVAE